jgi:CMP-N-acetylneuraminic acid synthetase
MFEGRRVLVIVPARGGSKGIPHKNLQPVLGTPLVARVGILVKALDYVDRAVLSTDDQRIADVGSAAGLAAPFRRPEGIAGDLVGDQEVLEHALRETERIDGCTYDVVLMLQPTCPLRRPEHVTAAILELVRKRWDAVWTVSPTDPKYHPLKQLTIGDDGALDYFDGRGASIIARQQLSPVYHRNGAAYAITRACLLKQNSAKGRRTGAVVIREQMVNIDTPEDIELAERHMRLAGLT